MTGTAVGYTLRTNPREVTSHCNSRICLLLWPTDPALVRLVTSVSIWASGFGVGWWCYHCDLVVVVEIGLRTDTKAGAGLADCKEGPSICLSLLHRPLLWDQEFDCRTCLERQRASWSRPDTGRRTSNGAVNKGESITGKRVLAVPSACLAPGANDGAN